MDGMVRKMKFNVFDYIDAFYSQDESWEDVLPQKCMEDYIREQFFRGASKEEAERIWENITAVCVYLGNGGLYLDDMKRDEFIDCVAWCVRNVGDCPGTPAWVDSFLRDQSDFFAYLKKRGLVLWAQGPAEARKALLPGGKLLMLTPEGEFLPQYKRYRLCAMPDLPEKNFLNFGSKLEKITDALKSYLAREEFGQDVKRAKFMLMLIMWNRQNDYDMEDAERIFWDYFVYDYRMLRGGRTPFQHFYDYMLGEGRDVYPGLSDDLLHELLQTRLAFFVVESKGYDGTYECRDIFTGKLMNLMLPLRGKENTGRMVFMGRIFLKDSALLDYMWGTMMERKTMKLFVATLGRAKELAAIRHGGNLSWKSFVREYPVLTRNLIRNFVEYGVDGLFKSNTAQSDYYPSPLRDDAVTRELKMKLEMEPEGDNARTIFNDEEIGLALQIWSDYAAAAGVKADDLAEPQKWAAGTLSCFLSVNNALGFEKKDIPGLFQVAPAAAVERARRKIAKGIGLEMHDPRYVNEVGLWSQLVTGVLLNLGW